tara:strand:- start:1111 stop:2214 length:1104 start_codon:yes stop_codon:yes gene_type:complete
LYLFDLKQETNKKVVVGMSGGVDSSVAAYLLKEKGYKVTGLFMQNWQNEPGEKCTSEIDFKDASSVCDRLEIPLHKANFSDDYWNNVFEEFLNEYKLGRTPNPDILCNREIKFKSFLNYALTIGADYIATGHYASLKNINDKTYLSRAKDIAKDQTYFLHEVKEPEFKKCIFPLENLMKSDVRKIAKEIGLSVSSKKDSVGICFVGEKNMKDFLGRFIKLEKGPILDEDNNIIGEHNGSTLYTIGQRQGLQIGGIKDKDDLPWYVYKKDILKNYIFVCQGVNNNLLYSKGLECEDISWINDDYDFDSIKCMIQIRHQHEPVDCQIDYLNDRYVIKFNKPIRGVALGQSAVFYKKNICMGGGVISRAF